jgi:hypothetical protein
VAPAPLPPFSVTWDYRCPFARNAHEHLLSGLEAGAGWDVTFVPFSLSQAHVEEGEPPVWEDPAKAADLMAMEAGIVVLEQYPDRFGAVHRALFAARHDEARDLREPDVVRAVLDEQDVPGDKVLAEIASGAPRQSFREAHESAAAEHQVWGVPTFIVGDSAVFVRLMTRSELPTAGAGRVDPATSVATIERVVGLVAEAPELNEFKHTSIGR